MIEGRDFSSRRISYLSYHPLEEFLTRRAFFDRLEKAPGAPIGPSQSVPRPHVRLCFSSPHQTYACGDSLPSASRANSYA